MTACPAVANAFTLPIHLAGLFPGEVAVAWRSLHDDPPPLPPAEARLVGRAVAKRRREFAAGRESARAALAACGMRDAVIPADPDRVPIWPPGFVGSITHCSTVAAATVGPQAAFRGIGLDIEERQVLEPELADCLMAPGESGEARHAFSNDVWPLVVFCAKEAAYKCIYPLTRISLDYQDLRVTAVQADGSFAVHALRPDVRDAVPWHALEGRLLVSPGYVAAGMIWRRAAA